MWQLQVLTLCFLVAVSVARQLDITLDDKVDDINECNHDNGGFSQKCHNTDGLFECLCETGFFLDDDDGKTCHNHLILGDLDTHNTLLGSERTANKGETACGGIYSTEEGTIAHPAIRGSHYKINERCSWIIRSSAPLYFYFSEFNTEIEYDIFYAGERSGTKITLITKLSGNSQNSTFTSGGDTQIIFDSDSSVVDLGFVLHWRIKSETDPKISDEESALEKNGEEKSDLGDNFWYIANDEQPEANKSIPEKHLGEKNYNLEDELNVNDPDHEFEEDLSGDLGELVLNDAEELDDFPSNLIDASDMPTLDGRTCFKAWDNLKAVEPQIQIFMTQDPQTHPNKCLNDENEGVSAVNVNPKIITEFKPNNFTKTPCYRSLDPEKKCTPGDAECNTEGEAGYCDCPLYTVWEGQRFCCPQCACHPKLTAKDNMFKCACIFDGSIESESI